MVPLEEEHRRETGTDKIEGGAFAGVMEDKTPFMYKGGEGINAGVGETEWVVSKDRYKYDAMFDTLNPIDGKVTGAAAKSEFSTALRTGIIRWGFLRLCCAYPTL